MKERAAYLIIFIFLIPLISFGQNRENNVSSNRISEDIVEPALKVLEWNMILENESKTEELLIEIKRKIERLDLFIHSQVRKGKVTIEVYDPKGTRRGYYTGGILLNSEKEEVVEGDIQKSLVEPRYGIWKVKIIPIDATGSIQITRTIGYPGEAKKLWMGEYKNIY